MNCVAPRCGAAASVGAVFCSEHLAAPPAKRGGWLSAHRRRLIRSNSMDETLDASNIARRLWVGSKPPFDRHLPEYDVLVLCAQEIQPQVLSFRGTVMRCPLPDSDLTQSQLALAMMGGRVVADALVAGRSVLVTCAQGINRSALVACLGLGLATYLSADQLVDLVRKQRNPNCLNNVHFRKILQRYIGSGRRPVRNG